MTWKITSINMDMIRDGYSLWDAMVYSRLWWMSQGMKGADYIYPSIEKIAKDLCMSQRQVIRCLQVLEGDGLIEVVHRGYKRRNNYQICDEEVYPCDLSFFND